MCFSTWPQVFIRLINRGRSGATVHDSQQERLIPNRDSSIRVPRAENIETSSQSYEGDAQSRYMLNSTASSQGSAETLEQEVNQLVADYQDSMRRSEVETQLQGLLYERIRQLEQKRNRLLQSSQSTMSNFPVVRNINPEPEDSLQGSMTEIDDGDSTDEENEAFQRQLQEQAERHARELEQVKQRRIQH
ncbi:unnamed protein product [Caenorhabditis brenneri]